MSAAMNPTSVESSDDLSALAWVQDELRRSLDAAHKSLRRFIKEAEAMGETDIDAIDPSVLRGARAQIHQGVGALELIGLPTAANVLRASEAAVQRFVTKPHKLTPQAIDDIERASFGLLDYLARMLAGKPVSTLALFPQYRAVQEASGADRVHPADLWPIDWQWRELPADATVTPRAADADTRTALEGQLLTLMRSTSARPTAARMSELCASLGAGASGQVATLWKLAAGVFEAQAQGLLGFDVFSKRVASRLLAQYRIIERGETEVSERLAQDLLFFCAQSASPGDGRNAPRLAAVRTVYGLAHHVPTDYTVTALGRFDPAMIAQARKRVGAAKEAWQAIAGGEMHRLAGLSEQFALVGDSLKRLFPLGETLAGEMQQAVALTQQLGSAPPAALAMEVATSLLYVEAALEDSDFDNPEQAGRVQRLAQRLEGVRQGQAPDPLEAWMEELYRRVSDRQTMGSVVQELRASLSEAEKLIDQFFRKPDERNVLIDVPHQLSAMRGVLSVLGMDHASAALLRMRDEIDGLISTEVDPQRVGQAGVFDRLAGNLGALGFLIDMLSVQPQMAKSLFRYDAPSGLLSPVMGRGAPPRGPAVAAPRLIEQAQQLAVTSARDDVPVEDVTRDLERLQQEAQAADQPALAATVLKAQEALGQAVGTDDQAAARGELSEALVDFVSTASDPVGLDPIVERRAADALPAANGSVSAFAGLDEDDEMREIFLEEAREVIANAKTAHADLTGLPDDIGLLTTLRRAFHTLKGSSRMVGLKEFGEAAWACEQLYNSHLADQRAAAAPLLDFTAWSLGELGNWVEDIAVRQDRSRSAAAIKAAAQHAGEEQAEVSATDTSDIALPFADLPLESIAPVAPVVPSVAPPSARPGELRPLTLNFASDLPAPADLDLRATPVPSAEPALPELSFELDLGSLDTPSDARPRDAVATSHPGPLDLGAQALHEPFDVDQHAATEPLPLGDTTVTELSPEALRGFDSRFDPIDLDLGTDPVETPAIEAAAPAEEENVRVVGPLRIGIPLFNIYLNEADELSRRLSTEVAEWAMELHRPIGETPIALAHSLAGSSATVGFADLSHLARLLEHAQMRSQAIGQGTTDEAQLFSDAAEEIRRLLHQFAAGFLKEPAPELLARLAEHEITSARRLEAATAADELAPPASEFSELGGLAPAGVETITFDDDVPTDAHALTAPVAEPAPQELVADTAPAPLPSVEVVEPAESGYGAADSRFGGLGALNELKPLGELLVETPRQAQSVDKSIDDDDSIDAVDAVDAELFPIFEEEAEELLPQLASKLRDWARKPNDAGPPAACMRTLHTLKGGARLAGAMRLGEMAHRLETRIEHLLARAPFDAADVETLQSYGDGLRTTFEALRERDARAYAEAAEAIEARVEPVAPPAAEPIGAPITQPAPLQVLLQEAPRPTASDSAFQRLDEIPAEPLERLADMPGDHAPTEPSTFDALGAVEPPVPAAPKPFVAEPAPLAPGAAAAPAAKQPELDWSRFAGSAGAAVRKGPDRAQSQSAVRVRAPLLDRLVNLAGEVSITRSRVESGVTQLKSSLGDLTENLERLRHQLRDIEFHGETQMTSRLEAAKAASQSFDPLEFDRFTRFQELTRMMAESVNDVATVQRTLQRSLETTEDELVAQARLTRDLQDDLLRTRMVEFEGLSDRLYRVVRQAAKETGKSVRLDIVGGSIEVDRGVLDRMTGSFEHLLRNCVTHGIEMPEARTAAGKDATGSIIVALSHEGNEVGVEFRDDGAGLNLARIRDKGRTLGLIEANTEPSDAEVANLIFTPGFSTADQVTELAGRGVGMDVVRSEVNAMGGRVETATAQGQGTSFKLILPLTTAVTQVVMLRCGETSVAVPSTLVEIVRRATPAEIDQAYMSGGFNIGERTLPFFWLGALLQISARPIEAGGRTRSVIVIRSAQQRVALHVDEVLGNQEVVVKNLGPQLATVPGLAGVTLLASGAVALIYNPVALATLYGESARAATQAAMRAPSSLLPDVPTLDQALEHQAPLVMVVDDSLTVRRVTQRLLLREGYRVVLAKDGLDALEHLAGELPQIVLSDIEMPRMDGFDLVRNMRADKRLSELPVIMITSRIAQKHRDYAAELGVDHYLGKPYSEEDLLALIARYTSHAAEAAA
jgi:chemosensory pili system protein ChpA (sensor histidine kinase/response regulator)